MILISILESFFVVADSIIRAFFELLLGHSLPQKSLEFALIETLLLTGICAWGIYKTFHRDPLPPAADYIIENRSVTCDPAPAPKPYSSSIVELLGAILVLYMLSLVLR